jgi:hypothetical protein
MPEGRLIDLVSALEELARASAALRAPMEVPS